MVEFSSIRFFLNQEIVACSSLSENSLGSWKTNNLPLPEKFILEKRKGQSSKERMIVTKQPKLYGIQLVYSSQNLLGSGGMV